MLKSKHHEEWLASSVDPDIIRLNVITLEGNNAFDAILYSDELPRRNDGRLTDGYLRQYNHLADGGWFCSGVDPLTGKDSLWGCFKPNKPRKKKSKGFNDSDKNQKIIKYEHPPRINTELFCLRVPPAIARKIAAKVSPLMEQSWLTAHEKGISFWEWVINTPSIPIILTEGAKKAGALLTAGYAAIALPGIYSGYRSKDKQGNPLIKPHLIPQLEVFCQKGREFIFCFDHETKFKKIKNIQTAIENTGKLLIDKGCRVTVMTWESPEKGVDDLIQAQGEDCLHALYVTRIELDKFKLTKFTNLIPYLNQRINRRYLPQDLIIPDDAQIIGLKSAKNTGKTAFLAIQVQKIIAQGRRVLVIVHRIQLAKSLCKLFGIDHIEEIRSSETGGVLGYGLCIDSLHPKSQARFNPSDWEGCDVIIDECEQVFRHILNSDTCQYHRVSILENLRSLLQTVASTGGRIYLSDADLSPISIDYVEKLIGFPIKRWVIQNDFNPNQGKRILHVYDGNDPAKIFHALTKAIARGERPIIHLSAQQQKSLWGTINVESRLKKLFKNLKFLRIDAETVADPSHPAYGIMENLNAVLPNYDVVIASPTIETGVSIDIKNYFTSVWCIAQGIQTVEAVCQTLERVRDDIPRHIWATKRSFLQIGNGSSDIKTLLHSEHKKFKAILGSLSQADAISSSDSKSPEHLITWSKYSCLANEGYQNYRENILQKLIIEGYAINHTNQKIEAEENESKKSKEDQEIETIKIEQKLEKELNYTKYCQEVAEAEDLDDITYKKLKDKRTKTSQERLQEKKGDISRCYLTKEVSPDMVNKHEQKWHSKLLLHYFLTVGKDHLKNRDYSKIKTLGENSNGIVFKHDVNRVSLSLKVQFLKFLGIEQFFNTEMLFTKDNLQKWVDGLIQKFSSLRWNIKEVLGLNINFEKESPIQIAQSLLGLFDLKLTNIGIFRENGKRVRKYKMLDLNSDGRVAIFQRWLERDSMKVDHPPE